jgi:hypothetical protein
MLPPVVLTVAIWFLTTPDPRPNASRRARAEAMLLRKVAILALVLEAIYWSVQVLNHFLRLRWQTPLNRAQIAWTLAWVVLIALLFRHLRRQLRRMQDRFGALFCTYVGYVLICSALMYQSSDAARLQFDVDWPSRQYVLYRQLSEVGVVLGVTGAVLAIVIFLMLWIELNHAENGLDLVPRRARLNVLDDARGTRIGEHLYDVYIRLRGDASPPASTPRDGV